MNKSAKIALCGIITALSFVVMMLTGIVTVGTYALPALAGLFLIVPCLEISPKWAVATYFSVSFLSILMATDKEASLIFILLFGYYPILKLKLEIIQNKILQYFLKLSVCNVSMILSFIIAIKLLGIPENSFEIFGVYLPSVFLVLGNIIFIVYDYAIKDIYKLYHLRFRRYIRKIFR